MMKVSLLMSLSFFIVGCGGGGNSNPSSTNTGNFNLVGSVPGTLIEAFGENGSYYKSTSTDDGTDRHPFSITLKQGVAYYLFMTVNEDTLQSITTPIEFIVNGVNSYRFTANTDIMIDLGHLNLYTTRDDAGGNDADNDGVLDLHHPVIVLSGLNLLSTPTATTTWDHDNDGIHNRYDNDYSGNNDDDGDGVLNPVDVNPNNDESDDNNFPFYLDRNNDGYLDEDRDRDSYYDDDSNRDGYHDDDKDQDGYHDDDRDRDGVSDSNGSYAEVEGIITAINGSLITMNVIRREYTSSLPLGTLVVDATRAYFEHTSLAFLRVGHYIEVEGVYNATTRRLAAYEIERDGVSDSNGSYADEVEGRITAINGSLITMNVIRREYTSSLPLGTLVVDATRAYFEHTSLAFLRVGHYIEVEGVYNATTRRLVAYEIERE